MKHIVAVCFLLFSSFGLATIASAGSIRGTVNDTKTSLPIEGVEVSVHCVNPDSLKIPALTDSSGQYSITGIPAGNLIYVIVAIAQGYVVTYARLDDLGSSDLVYNIAMEPNPVIPPGGGGGDSSKVTGRVFAIGGGSGTLLAVPGAIVSLTSGSRTSQVSTDGEGKYGLKLPWGNYTGSVGATGFLTLTLTSIRVDSFGLTLDAMLTSASSDVRPGENRATAQASALGEAYPNPFNPTTGIRFQVSGVSDVRLAVYDILGREVAILVNEKKTPGNYEVRFDAVGLSSGMYLYRLQAGSFVETKKLLLLR